MRLRFFMSQIPCRLEFSFLSTMNERFALSHALRDYSFDHLKDLTKSMKFSTARVLYAPVL